MTMYKATLDPSDGQCVGFQQHDPRMPVHINEVLVELDEEAGDAINDRDTYIYRKYTEFTWGDPVYPVDTSKYVQRFRMSQLKNHLLTEDEFIAIGDSADSVLQRVTRLGLQRNGWVDTSSPPFTVAVSRMLSIGIIDQARHDELSLGLPIEYVNIL